MTANLNFDLLLLLPELGFFLLVLFLFAATVTGLARNPSAGKLVLEALPVIALLIALVSLGSMSAREVMFWGSYRLDALSQFFKLLVAAGFFVAVLNARRQSSLEEGQRLDYFLFLAFSAWGLTMMASAAELVTIYLTMELASYSLYILIPLRARSRPAAEAGVKYILFGAAATALALYGLSWIIASQHSTYLSELAGKDWTFSGNPLACLGLSFFLGGMFYKLALFPFHFWCPDVYQGASNETAAYVATLPKLGAIAVLVRLGALITPGEDLANLLAVLAAASMTFGNLCALVQKDLKRMLGFSSVAHAGYILVGLAPGTAEGLAAAAFYAAAYLSMNLLCFWIISRLAPDGRNLTYRDLNGLYKRSPWLALSLAAAAISLVGLPPTVGFMGKLWLVTGAWGHGYNWLVILLCVNSALAIFYYLSLVRHAYTEGEDDPLRGAAPDTGLFSSVGATVLALVVLVLGVLPAPVFDLALEAGRALMP
ncbi:MAG: NADH-quinone oxidoreductase subunit N [Candidatus Adiutrix sp.]|jgi:NADH-quinone oxidoreductase subunit N|nr:NADH-quinone oxidoreductase subunit N [Candidatus Adiutrix sp.]